MSDKTKKYEFDNGYVVYRVPNVIERMKLIGILGISVQEGKREEYEKQSEFTSQARLMEALPDFNLIKEISLKVEDRTITTWEEAIQEDSFFVPLNLVVVEIMKALTGSITGSPLPGNEGASKP